MLREINISGNFDFCPDDPIYQEHFPGMPVVPGSYIIGAFIRRARNEGEEITAFREFSFRAFLPPGSYRYSMNTTEKGLFCVLYREGKAVVEGFLE